jgi:hypothetical protein
MYARRWITGNKPLPSEYARLLAHDLERWVAEALPLIRDLREHARRREAEIGRQRNAALRGGRNIVLRAGR